MSNTFFIADTHFGHKNIIAYENRPFKSVDEMDDIMIQRWNDIVSPDDTVYHLGDVALTGAKRTMDIVHRLHGKKILIKGNHDRDRTDSWWRAVGFSAVSDFPIVLQEFMILEHEPGDNRIPYPYSVRGPHSEAGFIAQHEPPAYFNTASPFVFIYGHVHSCPLYPTVMDSAICVSCERWNYAPVSIDTLISALDYARWID